MDSVGCRPWLEVSQLQVAEQGFDSGSVWDCATLSVPGHYLGKQEEKKPPPVLPSSAQA